MRSAEAEGRAPSRPFPISDDTEVVPPFRSASAVKPVGQLASSAVALISDYSSALSFDSPTTANEKNPI